ncbi:MAG: hypothetical protein V7K48_30395 [Nostoc sp.]
MVQLKSWLTDTAATVDAGYPDNRQLAIIAVLSSITVTRQV